MARKGTFSEAFTFEGKRYWAYGKTQDEAHDNAVKKRYAMEHNVKVEKQTTISVGKWAMEWLKSYKLGAVGDAWYKTMEGAIRNYIIPEIGTMRLAYVKPKDIQRFYNSHLDWSQSYGTTVVQIVRQVFDTAEENGLIEKNPAKRIAMPKFGDKVGHRTITPQERELTIRTADKYPEVGLFYLVMLFCGLRPQEVAALTYADIDMKQRQITVRQAKKSDDTIGKTKTSSGVRTVPIPDALYSRLHLPKRKPNEFVFKPPRSEHHTKTTLRTQWKRFKRLMDIENGAETYRRHIVETTLADDLVPYCYRHTYCTDLKDAGIPVTTAKVLMGHSSIRVTADIYTHHSTEAQEDARAKINALHKSLS